MASLGLAQIDENCSLIHTNAIDPLMLPKLLKRRPSLPDSIGEKTPESWLRNRSVGDCTPEGWPKTPTPHGAGLHPHFILGAETPEVWHESAPDLCFDAQQQHQQQQQQQQPPVNFQGVPSMMIPATGMTTMTPFVPMWPGQIAYPVGMVFDSSMASFASTCTTSDCSHMQSENLFAAPAPVPTEKVLLPNQANDSRQINASKAKPAPSAKKPTRGSLSPTELDGGDDACPVAVYVDLSALRERGSGMRH
jgi:hypothetical protein